MAGTGPLSRRTSLSSPVPNADKTRGKKKREQGSKAGKGGSPDIPKKSINPPWETLAGVRLEGKKKKNGNFDQLICACAKERVLGGGGEQ